eukprot:559177-Pyramimonas_sp.AAC.1
MESLIAKQAKLAQNVEDLEAGDVATNLFNAFSLEDAELKFKKLGENMGYSTDPASDIDTDSLSDFEKKRLKDMQDAFSNNEANSRSTLGGLFRDSMTAED